MLQKPIFLHKCFSDTLTDTLKKQPFYFTNTIGFQKSMNKVLGADQRKLAGNKSCSLGNVNICKEAIALSCGGNKG
ncbi:hypothetical protein P5673_010030 [Acropora cervicornis]|uniref:Uncharacterized protein n=1 Tax=Acropora cervicornis TaxID=6130 RepID=A0AAD9QQW9_ACRCE|nr:hypothetical protein P5673_010030 [Acropora cervicornis]